MTPSVELIGDKLGVQILGDRDIVFRNAERNFSITYRKVDLAQLLAAISVIRTSQPGFVKFCARAWKAACRACGGYGSALH